MGHKIETADEPLKVNGIGRDEQAPRGAAVILYLSRRPTDDEVRLIHNIMREASDDVALTPSRGCLNGLIMGALCWLIIAPFGWWLA